MKIKISLLTVFLLCGSMVLKAQGQRDPLAFDNVFRFGCTVTEAMRAIDVTAQSVAIKDDQLDLLFAPHVLKDKTISKILLGVKLNPKLKDYELSAVRSASKSFTAYRISDGTDAMVIAMGITEDNVDNYRYRVVISDSAEVVPWSKIPRLEKKYGASKLYGFVGKFNYPDKQVLVEVVNVKDYQIRDGVIFDWRKNVTPVLTNLMIYATNTGKKLNADSLSKQPEPYQIKHDPITNEITEISYEIGALSRLQVLVRDHPGIYYNVTMVSVETREHAFGTIGEGDGQQLSFMFNKLPNEAGTYQIAIRPQLSAGTDIKGQERLINVVVKGPALLEKKASIKQMLPYIIGSIVLIVLFFGGYYRRNQVKLLRAAQEKKVASLTLKSIRAQLNPHFMFNALTSIQNLMNKNDIKSANHYLAKFASLTRKVLNTTEQDMISLEDELKILDDYLQMEQLRFNFKYEIKVDDGINTSNVEVPAMLLQPFAENAVKHGVADLLEKGWVKVSIERSGNDLLMRIADNGSGFNRAEIDGELSFGIKMSEERVKLINDLYDHQPATLTIDPGTSGTAVTVKLTNWI